MGQEESVETVEVSPEELGHELALRFATTCYTHLELYNFKHVFRALADTESDIKYWSELSLVKFLQIPDVLGAGPVLYQMTTFLGAFPFASQAPCIVTIEALIKVVTLMTERHKKVLKKGEKDRWKLIYRSLAVFDNRADHAEKKSMDAEKPISEASEPKDPDLEEALRGVSGFSIDQPANDDPDEEDDEDQLALAALDSLDAIEAIGFNDRPKMRHSMIPSDNLLKLVELLILITPLDPQENLSEYASQLTDANLRSLRRTANNILYSFGIESQAGVTYRHFKTVIPESLPFLFRGLGPLFEHFLFEKSFDLNKRKSADGSNTKTPTSPTSPTATAPKPQSPPQTPHSDATTASSPPIPFPTLEANSSYFPPVQKPSLVPPGGELMTSNTLSQLSFFIDPGKLFHRLHLLYSGAANGFSMGAFEKSVLNWNGPTILLVSGTILSPEPTNSRERGFHDSLPPQRFPLSVPGPHSSGSTSGENDSSDGRRTVTYGAYITQRWKITHREPIGDASTLLFQLDPLHDVFRASTVSKDYVTFTQPPAPFPGIAFGSSLATASKANKAGSRASGMQHHVALGPVSLYLDDALEFGVFTHTAQGGGSFRPSASPARYEGASVAKQRRQSVAARRTSMSAAGRSSITLEGRPGDWQDRFEIESLEVWGCGGDKEVAAQRREIEFEQREAKLRKEGRSSVSGASGFEADKEILRMAGLIGHGEEGGSMV